MSPIERKIATKLVATLLAEGFDLGVHDGEETTIRHSKDANEIVKALGATELDNLRVYEDGERIGTVLLIWGNAEDLISDIAGPADGIERIEAIIDKAFQ